MCLILRKTVDQKISMDMLENMTRTNPHGWGIMYAEDKQVVSLRGMTLHDLARTIKPLQDRELFVHARQATHGTVGVENCHPFAATPDIWVMHNGMVSAFPEIDTDMSDTHNYVKYCLGPALRQNPQLWEKLDEFIPATAGIGSKWVLLRSDGSYKLVGAWLEWNRFVVSNTYSLTPMKTVQLASGPIRFTPPYIGPVATTDDMDEYPQEPESVDDLLALDYVALVEYCTDYPEEVARILYLEGWNCEGVH